MATGSGRRLIAFDRRLGARFVVGADEAGRGSLAGPLVAAAVLLDTASLIGRRAAALAHLNDSKQLDPGERESLYGIVLASARRVAVSVVPSGEIDRAGLHRSNLDALANVLAAVPGADVRLVDGFRLGPSAPPHRAVVDGDERSAAIAAASIVAKVTRDRLMARVAAAHPGYGFETNMGYAVPAHARALVRLGPTVHHRKSFAPVASFFEPAEEPATALLI